MSKPTEKQVNQILTTIFPTRGNDPTSDAMAKIQREAAKLFLDQLDEFFKKDETEYLENLRRSLVLQVDTLKKQLEEQSNTIGNLKTAKVEAEHKLAEAMRKLDDVRFRSQHTERIITNRTNAVIAKANERIRDAVPTDVQRELDDYHKLLASVRSSEYQDLHEYSSRWRVLTRAMVEANMNTPRFALFARADGNYILSRWSNIAALTGSPKTEKYDPAPFTHYMSVPKTSLQYLLNGPSPDPSICDGCPHHVTDPNAPNHPCALPDCIKDYTISPSAIGKSSNNIEN